jgi:hypothetical protein
MQVLGPSKGFEFVIRGTTPQNILVSRSRVREEIIYKIDRGTRSVELFKPLECGQW